MPRCTRCTGFGRIHGSGPGTARPDKLSSTHLPRAVASLAWGRYAPKPHSRLEPSSQACGRTPARATCACPASPPLALMRSSRHQRPSDAAGARAGCHQRRCIHPLACCCWYESHRDKNQHPTPAPVARVVGCRCCIPQASLFLRDRPSSCRWLLASRASVTTSSSLTALFAPSTARCRFRSDLRNRCGASFPETLPVRCTTDCPSVLDCCLVLSIAARRMRVVT